MNLIERVKNILITPKTEWEVINNETATIGSVFTGYVLPLSIVSCVGTILSGLLFTGRFMSLGYTIGIAVVGIIVSLILFYVTVLIFDALAPSFGSEKNQGKSAQTVAYSYTPSYIAGLLSFIPVLGWILPFAAWVYGVYIMYLGLGPMKKTPEDKKVVYLLVTYVILIAIYFILTAILIGIVVAAIFGAAGGISSLRA